DYLQMLPATEQYRASHLREFRHCSFAVSCATHLFEHLQQSPALSAITFRVQNSFALEVHIIDQGVAALSRTPHAFELLLHARAIFRSGFVDHLWHCVLEPV